MWKKQKRAALILACIAALGVSGCTPQNAATTGNQVKQEQIIRPKVPLKSSFL